MREYFQAYHSMLGAMRKLSDAECGRLFRALLMYSSGEQPNNLQGREELLFDVFSQQIDREIRKYEATCERNRRNVTSRYQSLPVAASGYDSNQDKEEDKDKEEDEEQQDARVKLDTVEAYCSGNLRHMSPGNMQELAGFKATFPDDVIRFAVDEACGAGAPRWAYVRAILDRYDDSGIKSVGDAKTAKAKHRAKQDGDYGEMTPENINEWW